MLQPARMSRDNKVETHLEQLLEELRVAIPGVQLLFAFQLTVPFNQRFAAVSRASLGLFVAALMCTCAASVLLIAPSVYHRLHARCGTDDKEQMLQIFNRLAIAGSVFLACGITASLAFLGGFLFGVVGALTGGGFSAALCGALWYALPLARRRHRSVRATSRRSLYHAQPREAAAHR